MFRSCARSVIDCVKTLRSRVVNPFDPPLIVLIYHRVTTLQDDPQQLAVNPEHFYSQLKYLKDHFPIVRFEDDWSCLTGPSVVVTFDDGYADNFLEALPIVEKVGVPVTFFISSGAIDSDEEFWWDELERLILAGGSRPDHCQLGEGSQTFKGNTRSYEDRVNFYRELHPVMRKQVSEVRNQWLEQLRTWAGCAASGRLSHRTLTTEQLRELANSDLVTIGSHGVTHTRLTNLSPEGQRYEILNSTQRLKELCGVEIPVFSYPFGGRGDYNQASLDICREAGFRRAAANFPGQVHGWSDPFQIPRQLVRDWPLEQFASKLNGFFLL